MTQESVRARANNLIEVMGTPQTFIAKGISCSKQTISYFLKNERDLALPLLQALDNFLSERGF